MSPDPTQIDPKTTNLKIYVGLGHLDPENLCITRKGSSSDIKAEKLLVKPGQIIFGKRRVYQRKIAVADFEGICSANAMVLEAIPEIVSPEYLPFFMQSDMFMDRAISISEGSMYPTLKWKTLADQEFPLPPRERQEEIIKLIKKFDETINLSENNVIAARKMFKIAISQFIISKHNVKEIQLNEIGSFYGGLSGKKGDDFKSGNALFIPYTNIINNFSVDLNDLEQVQINENEKQNKVENGDIFFTISSGTANRVGLSSVLIGSNINPLYLTTFCFGFRPDKEKVFPQFSKYFFRSVYFRKKIIKLYQGVTMFNITASSLGKVSISLPSLEEQVSV